VTRLPLIALLVLAAGPAPAVTITEIGGFDSTLKSAPLRASDFTRVGACGGGLSVQTDGCAAIPVGMLQEQFGRHLGEIDSQDADQLWNLHFAQPRQVIEFSVSDMMDMPWAQSFRITANADAVWEETQHKADDNTRYFQVVLDRAERTVSILFQQLGFQPGYNASNDGFGIGVCRKSAN